MRTLLLFLCLFSLESLKAQDLYFPPLIGNQWDTISPASLGWCEDAIPPLYDFLNEQNTKAFIVLKDGKIVLEKYFDDFTVATPWYWASAGKCMTATLVGIAQEQDYLSIHDTTSQYLDPSWTNCEPEAEALITIRHQLTMTTGLDDGVDDPFCTDADCLNCLEDAGTRWAYHNGPYTLLTSVVEATTDQSINTFFNREIRNKTGIIGSYINADYNRIFASNARSMARFGLLALNRGNWNDTPVLADQEYWEAMLTPSQTINPAYGYLWWLNGQSSFKLPGLQTTFNGYLSPQAPADMVMALGKNGQLINVVPSEGLVLIRMGNAPDESLIAITLNDDIWSYFNAVNCTINSTETPLATEKVSVFPNPASEQLTVAWPDEVFSYRLFDQQGKQVLKGTGINSTNVDVQALVAGVYYFSIRNTKGARQRQRLVVQ